MSESPLFVYAALKEALDARRIARKQGYLHKGDMRDDIAHILRVKPTAMVVLRLQPPR